MELIEKESIEKKIEKDITHCFFVNKLNFGNTLLKTCKDQN